MSVQTPTLTLESSQGAAAIPRILAQRRPGVVAYELPSADLLDRTTLQV
jgi:hypothetical protein